MQFAKLFTFATGQLLVTLDESEDPQDEAPYQLVSESRYQGVTLRMAGGFKSKANRDKQFAAMNEAKALEFFTKQQAMLQDAAS